MEALVAPLIVAEGRLPSLWLLVLNNTAKQPIMTAAAAHNPICTHTRFDMHHSRPPQALLKLVQVSYPIITDFQEEKMSFW